MGREMPFDLDSAEPSGFAGPFINGFGDPFRGWKEKSTGAYNPWKRPFFARRIALAILARASQFDVVHYHGHLPMVGRYLPPSIRFVQTRHDQGSECITHLRFRAGDVCKDIDPRACAACAHPSPGPLRTAISAAAVRRYRRESLDAFNRHPVIFVSQFLLDNFRRAVPQSTQIQSHVMHNFVDEAKLRCATKASGPSDELRGLVIHIAGRLEPAKGISQFIQLLLPRMPPHWRVHVYGDGPDRALLDAHDDPRLVLQGHQSLSAVLGAAAAASIAVVPSMWEEAFGLVTLEALRLGKPCYALRRGGTPELARYGAPGQLRLYEDLLALVDGLLATAESARIEHGGEAADVRDRLPQLLAVYRAARTET